MNKTAVQWLYESLILNESNPAYNNWVLDKAKIMEKEQLRLAYHEDRPFLLGYETGEFFEEHYQENYEAQND